MQDLSFLILNPLAFFKRFSVFLMHNDLLFCIVTGDVKQGQNRPPSAKNRNLGIGTGNSSASMGARGTALQNQANQQHAMGVNPSGTGGFGLNVNAGRLFFNCSWPY